MSGELYYRGSSLYEDAVEDTLQYFENWEDQNVSAIRNDIRESSYNIANTVLGVGIGLNNNMRANTNNLMYGMQNMTYGIQGDIRESTRMVLASQAILAERFNQGFNSVNNNLNVGFSILASGMQTLSDDITSLATGMYAMTEELCNKLDDLHDILKNPLLTESRELYRRAENNFLRGYYEEALEDCQKAVEKNKTDFISWYLLGHIYLFGAGKFSNVIDVDKAEESFFNAAKYIDSDIGANEEANKLASEIYYYLGYARFIKSNDLLVGKKSAESKAKLIEAEKASREAYKLSNDNLIAAYEQAKELHFLEKDDEALLILENLIRTEINFALKASSDKNFESIWGKIEELIKKLRDEIVEKIKPELDEIDRQSKMLSDIKAWGIKDEQVLAEIRQLLPPASIYETYFDVREFDETGKQKTLQQKMSEMIDCCMDKKYADSYFSTYKKAKEQYAAGNDKQTLDILKELIKAEWYFAVKSRCDIAFEKLWDKIDDLINNLRQESVFTMTPEIEEYNKQEKMLSEISAWGINTSDAFTTLKNILSNPDIFETMDYFSVREFEESHFKTIRQNMNDLVMFCLLHKNFQLDEEEYNTTKDLYVAGDEKSAFKLLQELIYKEWYFAVKSRCDKTFEPIWSEIDSFINNIREESISKMKPEIEEYKRQVEMLSKNEAWLKNGPDSITTLEYGLVIPSNMTENETALNELKKLLPNVSSFETMDYFSVRKFESDVFNEIQQKMNDVINNCLQTQTVDACFRNYQKVRELHISGDDKESLAVLEARIREEWYYYIKARCDKKMDSLWNKIDNLIDNLHDSILRNIKPKIEEYDRQVKMLTNINAWNVKDNKILIELKSIIPDESELDSMDYFKLCDFEVNKVKEIKQKMSDFIVCCFKNKSFYWGDEKYKNAEELHSSGNDEQALNVLEELIRDEWYFAIKASCDKKFETLWSKIDVLIEKLKKELEEKIKTRCSELRIAVKQVNNKYTKLDNIRHSIAYVKEGVNYLGDYSHLKNSHDKKMEYLKTSLDNLKNNLAEVEKILTVPEKDYYSIREFCEGMGNNVYDPTFLQEIEQSLVKFKKDKKFVQKKHNEMSWWDIQDFIIGKLHFVIWFGALVLFCTGHPVFGVLAIIAGIICRVIIKDLYYY